MLHPTPRFDSKHVSFTMAQMQWFSCLKPRHIPAADEAVYDDSMIRSGTHRTVADFGVETAFCVRVFPTRPIRGQRSLRTSNRAPSGTKAWKIP